MAKYFKTLIIKIFACCEGGHPHGQVLPGQVFISCFLKSGAVKDDTADADNADQDGEEDDADAASIY